METYEDEDESEKWNELDFKFWISLNWWRRKPVDPKQGVRAEAVDAK